MFTTETFNYFEAYIHYNTQEEDYKIIMDCLIEIDTKVILNDELHNGIFIRKRDTYKKEAFLEEVIRENKNLPEEERMTKKVIRDIVEERAEWMDIIISYHLHEDDITMNPLVKFVDPATYRILYSIETVSADNIYIAYRRYNNDTVFKDREVFREVRALRQTDKERNLMMEEIRIFRNKYRNIVY